MAISGELRKSEPFDVARMPMLDADQIGHLRRIENLSLLLPDDWSGMQAKSTLQEDFGGLRFQLAYMSYALALTHRHRLPAAPGVFRKAFERLIEKILSPDVWTYWHYISTGNGVINAAQGELPAEWNPVIKDNIMYSAYVQSMSLLYHYIFNDDRYAQPGALTMEIKTLYWAAGGKKFVYDERSLNDHLYWMMVEKGYLGIACEPNCVFQICNQVPILGFRFHDLVYGGSLAKEVTDGYQRAWSDFGIASERGHFRMMVQEIEKNLIPTEAPWIDFWLGSLMHAWNPELVKHHYPGQIAKWGEAGPDDTLWINEAPGIPTSLGFTSARDFGWAAVCASEVGDEGSLTKMLAYADRFLHRSWTDGGLHYRRHDASFDDQGLFRAMDPHTGNALLGYARLNVPGGLERLYAEPWDKAHFEEPALVEISDNADVLRARFERDAKSLVLTLAPRADRDGKVLLELGNIWGRGDWSLAADGEHVLSGNASELGKHSGAVGAKREGDILGLECALRAPTNFVLTFH
ncbi:hypothetical protein [Agrobacterium vitis]|uniref:Linalool dehydratase/isomerase domain-containing protein n=1 Tax=Agrobacterium vitis TaxID=373 RepID=A0AAE2URJ2_AGRVI|nr:hypothetical protein [Agrobacterium vitis]MBF2714678.1 hypothetical protein [Agrobacterium vitis]MUZ63106.1 hypothetical protein [Agrobacterium vitis]MVA19274.1 hypothetical protein [Agrobacterium vitis]